VARAAGRDHHARRAACPPVRPGIRRERGGGGLPVKHSVSVSPWKPMLNDVGLKKSVPPLQCCCRRLSRVLRDEPS